MVKTEAIRCLDGWKDLYQPVLDKIIEYDNSVDTVDKKIGIDKVYEKEGILVIDVVNINNITTEIKNQIIDASRSSMITCEFCGSRNDVGLILNHSIKTCCRSCWTKKILPNISDSRWRSFDENKVYIKKK